MKNLTKETKARLEKFKDLYSSALLSADAVNSRLVKHMDQYLGSDEIDGSTERAGVVRNITYELIESAISSDIPYAKVSAESYSERGEMLSQAVERLLYTTRERLPLDEINDTVDNVLKECEHSDIVFVIHCVGTSFHYKFKSECSSQNNLFCVVSVVSLDFFVLAFHHLKPFLSVEESVDNFLEPCCKIFNDVLCCIHYS